MDSPFVKISFLLFMLSFVNAMAQNKDSTSSFKLSGYTDVYYAHYSDSVGTNKYRKFPAVSPKSNEFGLNIVQLTGQYTSENIRAVTTLHYGDMPAANWSPVFNMIQEANMGFRLAKGLWLDAGFFKTHIGTEAFLPKDNITSSISVITLYEPWFQAGAKLTYNPNDRLTIALHLLNGYNTFVAINNKKSPGLSVLYILGRKGSIGYYNLISDDTPDADKTAHLRFLNNLVFNYEFSKKFKMLLGADLITQQNSTITDSTKTAFIYSGILTLRYQLASKLGIYVRAEAFSDADGFLTGRIYDSQHTLTGYKLYGQTTGLEYKVTDNSYIRLETRELEMDKDQKIFYTNGAYTNKRTEVMLNCGVWF
jgi:hypothetical protein